VQRQLKEAGASEIILAALRGEGAIMQQAREFIARFISTANVLLELVESEQGTKASGRVTNLNNLGFALANIGRFTESIGAVGMPKDLRKSQVAGQDGNGQPWEKGMLQQINVTVKNIQASAEAAKQAEPAIEAEPAP